MDYKNIKKDSKVGMYIPVPVCLIKTKLGSTTLLIYGSLLSRAMLSQKNGWTDGNGDVFIRFAVAELAEYMGKGTSTVKVALKELEDVGLIKRKRADLCTTHIYVRVPENCLLGRSSDHNKPDYCMGKVEKISLHAAGKLTTNNYREIQNIIPDRYTFEEGESF